MKASVEPEKVVLFI